jgi:DNA-binding Lrp family transcriptional regulator
MDQLDSAILRALREDSSKSTAQLARELRVPRPTIHYRIQRLKDEGIIRRFTVLPDYAKLGMPVAAFVLVSFLPNPKVSQRELGERIARLAGIQEVHLISGQWDMLLKVRGGSIEEIGRLVIDKLRAMEGVGGTVTCASFSTVKEE